MAGFNGDSFVSRGGGLFGALLGYPMSYGLGNTVKAQKPTLVFNLCTSFSLAVIIAIYNNETEIKTAEPPKIP